MLPEDNIESENFQMWHDWHGKELSAVLRRSMTVHSAPAAAVFIFVFIPSLWSSNSMLTHWAPSLYQVCEENWIEKIMLWDWIIYSFANWETPFFLCLIYQDQIVLSRGASVSRQSLFPGKWLTSEHEVSDIKSFIFAELHIKCTLI